MMLRNWRAYLWLTATILFMILIFLKSAEPYQEQDLRPALAGWVPLPLLKTILPQIEFHYGKDLITWQKPYDMLEFFIRKSAHVTEYAILTFLWIRTLNHTGLTRSKCIWLSGIISLLYAASDEWHQTFVQNRTGQAIDVGVDAIGIMLILTACGLQMVGRKK